MQKRQLLQLTHQERDQLRDVVQKSKGASQKLTRTKGAFYEAFEPGRARELVRSIEFHSMRRRLAAETRRCSYHTQVNRPTVFDVTMQ